MLQDSYICIQRKDGRFLVEGPPSRELIATLPSQPTMEAESAWASWRWADDQLVVRTSIFGGLPLFYACPDNTVVVSTSLTTFLAKGLVTDYDYAALSLFFQLGWFVGDSTPFKNVKAFLPNTDFRWSGNVTHHAWNYIFPEPNTLSREECKQRFQFLLNQSIREALEKISDEKKIGLPLSGGRDSRHILFALLEQGRRPDIAVTVGETSKSELNDARVAASIAAYFDIPHIPLPGSTVTSRNQEEEKNIACSFSALEHGWGLQIGQELEQRGMHCAFDGIGGDVLSAGLFADRRKTELFDKGALETLATEILGARHSDKLFLKQWKLMADYESAAELLQTELRLHVSANNPVNSFYFWNRTRRAIGAYTFGMLGRRVSVLTPYLKQDIIELLLSCSPDFFLDKNFHNEVISSNYPEFQHLEYANGPKLRRYTYRHLLFLSRDLLGTIFSATACPMVSKPQIVGRVGLGALFNNIRLVLGARPKVVYYLSQLDRLQVSGNHKPAPP